MDAFLSSFMTSLDPLNLLLMALCALSDAVGVDAETALRTGLERRIRRLEEEV